jgi:aarF domain-containing kinase
VLGAFLPISLLAALFPSRISCRAYELPASTLYNRQADNSGAVFTPAAVRIKAQHAAQQQPLTTLLSQARGAISLALVQLATELAIMLRGIYLTALFSPVLLMSPLVFNYDMGRAQWLLLLRWTLEKAGPAFIKWGQWGSTRPDLFPRDVCAALEALQSNAPSHAAPLSVAMVEAAFNRPLRELFSAWEAQPIASGSIAQIHRARLSPQAAASCGVAAGTLVAVKVRHPGVECLMAQDFVLMDRAARLAGYLPGLKSLRLDESVRQFGGPLQEQLDLSVEAQHLSKFARNFRSWRNVKFPVSVCAAAAAWHSCCLDTRAVLRVAAEGSWDC